MNDAFLSSNVLAQYAGSSCSRTAAARRRCLRRSEKKAMMPPRRRTTTMGMAMAAADGPLLPLLAVPVETAVKSTSEAVGVCSVRQHRLSRRSAIELTDVTRTVAWTVCTTTDWIV
jgi:hypothetical protein